MLARAPVEACADGCTVVPLSARRRYLQNQTADSLPPLSPLELLPQQEDQHQEASGSEEQGPRIRASGRQAGRQAVRPGSRPRSGIQSRARGLESCLQRDCPLFFRVVVDAKEEEEEEEDTS
mmetsp:Transcript_15302/g.29665  ORF Transcript_15302/g.29665 Transcript_15302/m.29665 type:complete len:122 (-) Transcript_15302:7-372(-)